MPETHRNSIEPVTRRALAYATHQHTPFRADAFIAERVRDDVERKVRDFLTAVTRDPAASPMEIRSAQLLLDDFGGRGE